MSRLLLRYFGLRVRRATVGQVRRLVDGLDAETCLTWAHEIAPDEVPSCEAWGAAGAAGVSSEGAGAVLLGSLARYAPLATPAGGGFLVRGAGQVLLRSS